MLTPDFQRLMAQATQLTREGRLREAGEAIQAALRGAGPAAASTEVAAVADVIDVVARVVPDDAPAASYTEPPAAPPRTGEWLAGHHAGPHGARDWRLFVPPQAGTSPRPLLLMLHGCTQDAEDFARGTGMNELARDEGVYVLYPTQSEQVNPQRCWNWFKRTQQRREFGEPALLAGLVREIGAAHAVDASRIYVAGLSAGGAMAALLGRTHPDLFAAVGIHSGLPAGAAHDLRSAYAAMRRTPEAPAPAPGPTPPTIVVHGDRDATVHADNGRLAAEAAAAGAVDRERERIASAGRHAATRERWFDAQRRLLAEHWLVHGAGHAWSGGRPAGSFTDPAGPDASRAMLDFFARQRR